MTIKELAKLAGVSTATVSRAMNGVPGVNPDKQKRILELAAELDYRPNLIAKGFSTQKTFTIGVCVGDIINPFFAEVMKGIEEVAEPYNYTVVFFNTNYDVKKERRALDFLKDGRIDGLIASVSMKVIDECISLADMNRPFVVLGHLNNVANCAKVGCNNFSSAYTITEYLIKAGHRKIAHVAGHRETKTGQQRREGFCSAMENYDLVVDPQWIIGTNYLPGDAYTKVKTFLEKDPDITAVFVANDYMVAGVYRAILEQGLRIPEDISVVGHDDIETSVNLYPGLTTMRQQMRKVGRTAGQNLFEAIERGRNVEKTIIIPTSLVERDSVKKLLV